MKIKEIRYLHSEDLRLLCISNRWFTHGDYEDYDGLFSMVRNKHMTPALLLKVAQYIQKYSDPESYADYGLEGMIFKICRTCYSTFRIEE